MREYAIHDYDGNFLMRKTTEDMKEWIKRFNVTDHSGDKADLRNVNGHWGVWRVNGQKLVLVTRTITIV